MNTKKLSVYLLAGLFAGCVPILSLHPLFTEEDLVFERKLVGTWVDDSNGVWEFRDINEPEKAYELKLTDKEGNKGLFVVRLVKLKDKLFMDVMAKQFPCGDEDIERTDFMYNAFFFVPAHAFIRVDSIESELRMRWAQADKVKELLEKDPNAVRHEVLEDNVVLTAGTKELQRFVLKYCDDREVFNSEVIAHRKQAAKSEEQ